MAKTTKKTTAAKKTTRRKSTSAKESPRRTKKSPARSSNKKTTRATGGTQTQKALAKKKTAGEAEVTIDRRRSDRRTSTEPAATDIGKLERREKVTRRRQIDPTTCERDYSDDEVEFMGALDNYKRASGRMFPTCSEILEVIRKLGYAKMPVTQDVSANTSNGLGEESIATDLPLSVGQGADDSTDDEALACEELHV